MHLSAAICTYNHSRLLRWALEGLTRVEVPSGLAWELVVVDNHSTDDTRAVAEAFKDRLPLKYVFEPVQGFSSARRRAFRETSAEWLAFIDDDCLLDEAWLREAVQFCQTHPRAGAVGGRVHLLWQVTPDRLVQQFALSLARQDHGDQPRQLPNEGFTYLVGAGLVVRRSALAACDWPVQGQLPDRRGQALNSGGDSEMVLRIRNAGYELWYNPAMELRHWIPKRRMTVPYLCRLMRGMGQSQVFLDRLASREAPTLWRRARTLASSLEQFGHALLAALGEFRRLRRLSAERRVLLSQAFGSLEGAISLLWHGYRV